LSGELFFSTYTNPAGVSEKVRIRGNGNVGIGVTNPGARLEVVASSNDNTIPVTSVIANTFSAPGAINGTSRMQFMTGTNTVAYPIGEIRAFKEGDFYSSNLQLKGGLSFWTQSQNGVPANGYTEKMRIASDGHIGIGTTSPSVNLHITDTSTQLYNELIRLQGQDGFSVGDQMGISFCQGPLELNRISSMYNGANDWGLLFKTLNSNVSQNSMYLNGDGCLGIGTTNPAGSKLNVTISENATSFGSNNSIAFRNTSTAPGAMTGIAFWGNSSSPAGAGIMAQFLTPATIPSTNLIFYTTDGSSLAERMRLSREGNLGIGSASPLARLEIYKSNAIGTDLLLCLSKAGAGSTYVHQYYNSSSDWGTIFSGAATTGSTWDWLKVMYDTSISSPKYISFPNGNVGIGVTTPTTKLTIKGNAIDDNWGSLSIVQGSNDAVYRQIYMNGSYLFFYNGANNASLNPAGAWTNASDRSYKKDIQDINYGLSTVMKMQPREYRMRSDNEKQIGFVAQELENVVPEVVSGVEGKKGVSYGNLTAVLTKAIQEQQKQFEQYKAEKDKELAQLKAEIEKLKRK
ncbi:MAG: tail fiber domain-containing protein, partial [Candidatus Margulisiibacteriota bacterium]|jgi:hypothetical protein